MDTSTAAVMAVASRLNWEDRQELSAAGDVLRVVLHDRDQALAALSTLQAAHGRLTTGVKAALGAEFSHEAWAILEALQATPPTPQEAGEPAPPQAPAGSRVLEAVKQWQQDESGYEEDAWPKIQKVLGLGEPAPAEDVAGYDPAPPQSLVIHRDGESTVDALRRELFDARAQRDKLAQLVSVPPEPAEPVTDVMDWRVWLFCHARVVTVEKLPYDAVIEVRNEDGCVCYFSSNAWHRLNFQVREAIAKTGHTWDPNFQPEDLATLLQDVLDWYGLDGDHIDAALADRVRAALARLTGGRHERADQVSTRSSHL